MGTLIVDLETLPIDAAPGCVPPTPPHTPPPRRTCPANYGPDAATAWERKEDERHAAEVAQSGEIARRTAYDAWADGSLTWDRSRIGCVGLYHEQIGPVIYDCEEMGEVAALEGLGYDLEAAGEVWAFGMFDARILRARYLAHHLPIPRPLRIGAKPWDRRWHDLQAVAAECLTGRASEIRGISVDAICRHLGIVRAPSPVDGAGVLDAYLSGRWGEVIEHCRADVVDEWAILGRLRGVL